MDRCVDCNGENIVSAYIRSPRDANITRSLDDPAVKPDNSYYVILRCEDCGSVFLHPFYWEESFSVYTNERYFTGYFPNNIHTGSGPSRPRLPRYAQWRDRRRARHLLQIVGLSDSPSPKVCDIGCASGLLVRAFKELGCEAYGAEISQQAIEAQNKGLNVHYGPFEDACYPSNFFDMITAMHVFEHMGAIDRVIQEMLRTTKSDGIFLCKVPNDIEGYRIHAYRKI